MFNINVPESIKEKADELKSKGLTVEVITDSEYIKRFGKTSFDDATKS